jgi:hypothetical protein
VESRIILYHSDEEKKCKDFIEKTDVLILSENIKDDIWLGQGMYFWDNLGNANWWKRKQCSRHADVKYCIAIANVVLNNLLDLTDFEVYMTLEKLWKQICQKSDLNENVQLGNKLNFLFDTMGFQERYDIIKVYGKYNNTSNKGFFKFDYNSMKSEPTIGVKCIYSVRNAKCIVEKDLIKEEIS